MSKGYMAADYAFAPSGVTFSTTSEGTQRVFDQCEALARQNIKEFGARTVLQEGAKYHGVWLETQPMGGEMYAKRNIEVGLNNILIFMHCQRRDGRMPGMITFRPPYDGLAVHMDWMQGDFFTLPAFKMYYHIGQDKEYLKKLYTALKDFDNYLWTYRDSTGDGCLECWCTWDTGEDNNTRFLANGVHARDHGAWNGEVPPENRGLLPFKSAEYMAYSYAQRDTLSKISALLENGETQLWRDRANALRKRFIERLWDSEHHYAFDRNCHGEVISTLTLANLKCMYNGIFTQAMADFFIAEHMLNPKAFWTPLPLPNIAANDPLFYVDDDHHNLGDNYNAVMAYASGDMADNSWAGPVQGLNVQRSIHALTRYGHHCEATMIGLKWLDNLALHNRYVQQYNPFTGAPAPGENGYGPTVLSALEYIGYLYGVTLEEGLLLWSAARGENASQYTQQMYNSDFSLSITPKEAVAIINGSEAFRFTPGVRIQSTLNGIPERIYGLWNSPVDFELTLQGQSYRAQIQPNEQLSFSVEKGLKTVQRIPFNNNYMDE